MDYKKFTMQEKTIAWRQSSEWLRELGYSLKEQLERTGIDRARQNHWRALSVSIPEADLKKYFDSFEGFQAKFEEFLSKEGSQPSAQDLAKKIDEIQKQLAVLTVATKGQEQLIRYNELLIEQNELLKEKVSEKSGN